MILSMLMLGMETAVILISSKGLSARVGIARRAIWFRAQSSLCTLLFFLKRGCVEMW